MATQQQKKKKGNYLNWLVPGAVILVILAGAVFFAKVLLTPAGSVKKTQISTVNLMKPPPPPEQKEKPPEPEVPKEAPKVESAIQTPQDTPQNSPDNSPPPGADLGVDAEGGAGGDGFGLVGKKGGRGLTTIGGGGGGGGPSRLSLMTKYGWYTAKIQEELKRQMRKRLDENGGIPKGKLQATVKLVLDPRGTVVRYQIIASSGNEQMDEALKLSLPGFRISQPPPEGMPAGMTIRITSQG